MISDCMRQFKSRSKVFFFYSRKRNIILTTTARLCFFCILSLSDCARNTIHKCLVKYFNQTMSTYIYIYNNGVTDRASRYRTEKRGEKKETLLWKGKENFSFLKLIPMITRRTSKIVTVITRGGEMAIVDKLHVCWRRGSHLYM